MFADLRFRLRALFSRSTMERELDDELRFHLEHETAKLVARGMSRMDAERQARLSLGGLERTKDEARSARGVDVVDALTQDLRYAWRGILARPGFSAAVILALALGIGANTAMFGVVDRLLFRPPAYLMDAGQVNRVYLGYVDDGKERVERTIGYTRYTDLTRWTTSFDKTAIFAYRDLAVGVGEQTRNLHVAAMSATMFDLFDAKPALGRFFDASDDRTPIGEPVVVLSYGFWQSEYGGSRDVIGTKMHIGTIVASVIGVAPRDFAAITDDSPPALYMPVTTIAGARSRSYFRNYQWSWLEMFARRKPGVSIAAATADLTNAYRRSWSAESQISSLPADSVAHPRAIAGSLHVSRGPEASAESKVATWVMGVAAIVLLVACANVANLLLARAVSRRREVALRVALGVGRGRLVQQFATESVLLATLGGVAGLAIAGVGGRVLSTMFTTSGTGAAPTDGRTLAFVAIATLGVALLTGLAPALHALRGDLTDALKAGSRDSAYRRSRVGTALLLFQGAFSVVLLVGAGLFVRSLYNVRTAHFGYDIDPVVLIEGNMRGVKLAQAEQNALNEQLLEAAQATPGVTAATLTMSVPFYSNESRGAPHVPGRDSLHVKGSFLLQGASPDYFKTVGTRILQGRAFLSSDRANTQPVAVISQTMATAYWPNENALGKQFRLGDADTTPLITIVGVAETMRGRQITGGDGELWYYLPISQVGDQYTQIFARVSGNADDAVPALRKRLQTLMPGAAYITATPLKTIVGGEERAWEFGAKMFMAFGGLALFLAALGLYSVIAYAVAQRTRELGVRIALGASSGNVMRMIVGQGVTFAIAGIGIGSLIALAASKWVEPLLFAQSATDPFVYVGVGVILLIVAIAASARPALRAMSVDPSEVLRGD